MRINKQVLEKLRPCEDRLDNYLEHYESFDGSFDDFLDLEKLTYDDKMWVAKKVLSKNQLFNFAILCAESVLPIFEERYPKNKRPYECLEFLKTIEDVENISEETRKKIRAHRAAAYAANTVYYAATYAGATDASGVYYVTACAATASANAACAAYDAESAYYATDARKNQQDLNLTFLKMAGSL